MGGISIRLLGSPELVVDGSPGTGPKGKKAWGLLAYLLLTRRSHGREHLAELLFSSTDDPLGSLRWNLAQLRKALRLPDVLKGSVIQLDLPPGSIVDVHVLTSGTWAEAVRMRGLGSDLLQGASFSSDHVFDSWLMVERTRVRSLTQSVLREAASACLGTGRFEMAADFATRAISVDVLDEGAHETLIRALVAQGYQDRARDALDRCLRIFQEELGCEPSRSVKSAIVAETRSPEPVMGDSVTARAQLDLGRSALHAGAVETGIDGLRRAVTLAEAADDEELWCEALFALAHALVHSVRGRDGEAATLLHKVVERAERLGSARLLANALRELGYIDMLTGRYDRALGSLERALETFSGDPGDAIWNLSYQAICHSDTGRYPEAELCLERCMELTDDSSLPRQTAYVHCLMGRLRLLCGRFDEARSSLQRSIEIATGSGWIALVPWPESLLAEIDLRDGGDPEEARSRLERALSLARQLQDPCWEASALHGLGLLDASLGATDSAAERLEQATVTCTRFPDSYLWMKANLLDALCDVGSQARLPGLGKWITDLETLAARSGMTEFLARSYHYRELAGDPGARATARVLAGEVDNPALTKLLES
ncbi:MAG: tetratricopeptide repeat protein [Actinomycetota bacterium]